MVYVWERSHMVADGTNANECYLGVERLGKWEESQQMDRVTRDESNSQTRRLED